MIDAIKCFCKIKINYITWNSIQDVLEDTGPTKFKMMYKTFNSSNL